MSSFKNMKIAITHEQPLDDVVEELERIGLSYDEMCSGISIPCAIGVWFEDNTYCTYGTIESIDDFELTTLTELKEMQL